MTDRDSKKGRGRDSCEISSLVYTRHAQKRMRQRNISPSDIRLAMRYGRKLHRTGIGFYFLGQKDLPEALQRSLEDLEGTTVLFDPHTAEIITVYRNPEGLRDIKRKAKYSAPKHLLRKL